jgi:ribosomal protein S8
MQKIISILVSQIHKKSQNFSINIQKKDIELLAMLQNSGYLQYHIINRKNTIIQCNIQFCYDKQREILIKHIRLLSTNARKIFTKKHKLSHIYNSKNINTIVRTTNGVTYYTNDIGGILFCKIIT